MPLFNVCGLGFSWPLAEARACALAAAMKGDALAEFDASLLHRIDTAANPLALAVQCSSRFSGFSRSELQLLVQKISSRQVMAVRLQRLQDSVQSQWITQFVKYGLRTSDSPVPSADELLLDAQRTLHDRRRPTTSSMLNRSSRHVVSEGSRSMLSGLCLASVSLLFGDGKPADGKPQPEFSSASESESESDGDGGNSDSSSSTTSLECDDAYCSDGSW